MSIDVFNLKFLTSHGCSSLGSTTCCWTVVRSDLGPKLGTTNFNMLHFDVWLFVPGITYVDFLWQRIFLAQKEVSSRKVNGIDNKREVSERIPSTFRWVSDGFPYISRSNTFIMFTWAARWLALPPRGGRTFTGIPTLKSNPKKQKQLNIWGTSDYLILVQSDPSPFQTSL